MEQSDLGLHSLIWVCTICLCSIPIFRLQEYLVTFRWRNSHFLWITKESRAYRPDSNFQNLEVRVRFLSSSFAFVRGWSGGVMVLGKLPVPGRPTIWITVGQGPIALAVGAGGVVWTFLLSPILLLFLPLFGRRLDIDWNIVSKGR